VVMPQVMFVPTVSVANECPPRTATGSVVEFVDPSPSSPLVLNPSSSRARACERARVPSAGGDRHEAVDRIHLDRRGPRADQVAPTEHVSAVESAGMPDPRGNRREDVTAETATG